MFRVGSLKRSGLFFGVAALAAVACGGIDEPNFFSSDGTTTTSKDSGTSTGDDAGHVTANDGGTTPIDSGIVTVIDSGAPPPADPGIFCGTDGTGSSNVYCDPSTEFCCATGQDLGTPTFACGTDKNSCTNDSLGGVVIPCDKPSECGGQYCCGQFQEGSPSQYTQVRCQNACAGTNARIFCDPANGDADCRGTGTCGESGTLPGFYVCSK
jgi:hypothetical protein